VNTSYERSTASNTVTAEGLTIFACPQLPPWRELRWR
jgi:hypothetical protein